MANAERRGRLRRCDALRTVRPSARGRGALGTAAQGKLSSQYESSWPWSSQLHALATHEHS